MGRKGFALLTVIFIMLALAIIGVGVVTLIFTSSRSTIDDYFYDKAFYIADAGRVYGTKLVLALPDWSAALTTPLSKSFGGGAFTITGTDQATGLIRIISVGLFTEEGKTFQRTVTATLNRGGTGLFSDFVLYFGSGGSGGSTAIGNNVSINGDILINGSLTFGSGVTVTGDAYATGTINGGTVTGSREAHTTLPGDLPTLDTTYYDNQIALAAASSTPSQNWGSHTVNSDIYINGNLTINNSSLITVVGAPKLVVKGNVTTGNNVRIGDNLTLIAGGAIIMGNGTVVGDHCLFYSTVGFTFGNNLDTASFAAGQGTSFLTPGDVTMGNNASIYGFIYAGDEVVMGNNAAFTGNIIAGEVDAIGNNAVLTADSTLVDYSTIPGFSPGGSASTAGGSWEETY